MRLSLALLAVVLGAVLTAPVISCAAAAPRASAPSIQADPLPLKLPAPKAGHAKPLVAVIADNKGSETTDFTIPYGVLKDSGAFDVVSASTRPGPVKLMMTLSIQADTTLTAFAAAHPEGADIVIVPAMMDGKDPALLAWLHDQASHGAVIVSICEGARVIARAGLLHGKAAATHWSAMDDLAKQYPDTAWIRDTRYVQSGNIISTTGVTASIPLSLALIEAAAGKDAALAEAARLGVADWSPAHRTDAFRVTRGDIAKNLWPIATAWARGPIETPITQGVDEIALALTTDSYGRIFRGSVVTTSLDGKPVISRHGLIILPDARPRARARLVLTPFAGPPAKALDAALSGIEQRFGKEARRIAALGLEYPDRPI